MLFRSQKYKIAVRDKDQKFIDKYKPVWEKAQAEYKKFQDKKNALTKELKAAEKEATAAKETAAKNKAALSVYDKTLENLKEASLNIKNYQGTDKYVAAYQAAQVAYNDAVKAGASPSSLPAQLAPVPPVVEKGVIVCPEGVITNSQTSVPPVQHSVYK